MLYIHNMGKSGCYCCVYDVSSNKMISLDPSGKKPVCCIYDESGKPDSCVIDLSGNGPVLCIPEHCECECKESIIRPAEPIITEPVSVHGIPPEKKSIVAKRMIEEVRNALKTESPAAVSARFSDYQAEFPKLFAILLNRDYPHDVLSMMIAQIEGVENGKMSKHDASVAVGAVLVERFVKPQLGPANPK